MPIEGMDVDQLEALAKQLDRDAQALYNLVTSLNGVISGFSLLWQGPVAAAFEQDWQSKNRPALLAAHNTLTNLHGHLVSNINQQRSASAADGGWTTGGVGINQQQSAGATGGGWTAERIGGDLENALKVEDLANKVGVTKLLDGTPVGRVLPVLDVASLGLGLYHVEKDRYAAYRDLTEGQYGKAASEYVDSVSEELKTASGPLMAADPLVGAVVYGAGVDLKLGEEVANLDWKDTPNPLNGSNWEKYYEPEFSSMGTTAFWKQAGKTLWGAM